MVANIFQTIGQAVTAFASVLSSAVTSVTAMFYDAEGLTLMGTLLLIASGVGLVYWAFNLIRRLIKRA